MSAQYYSTKSKKAIALFEQARVAFRVGEREELLQQAIKKDKNFVEAYWLLAQYFDSQNRTKEALTWLEKIDNKKSPRHDETLALIAELYYNSGQYQMAIDKAEQIDDGRYFRKKIAMLECYREALKLYENPVPFDPVNLKRINTRFDDYFPSITADGKQISTTVLVQESDNYEQEEIYFSRLENGQWQIARPLNPPMNTDQNEGSQSFSTDGRYMFFVACNRKDGLGGCDIYYSVRQGDRWSVPQNAGKPVNSEYWESNPVLSPAGDELFFVSNRLPNLGGKDIWHCRVAIDENGYLLFGKAENLGRPVNTEKDDFAPFIHADNQTLYFASNGHGGLGRSDIFVARRTADGWSEPQNIGYPINTAGEESGLVVDASGEHAYFASDHIEHNNQRLDIYQISLPTQARPQPMNYVVGRVFNADNGKPIEAEIEIFDTQRQTKIFESMSDKISGNFTAYLPENELFSVHIAKRGYLFYSDQIAAQNDSMLIALQPVASDRKIVLKNLFFAFNSAEIQPQSQSELSHLVAFLRANPKVRIEISGHTDNVGTEAYNLQLSQQRAEAVRQALVAAQIGIERLVAVGKGADEPIAPNDTDENRATNRRVEIKILGN